jgi:uroporphyrinogen-III synthase
MLKKNKGETFLLPSSDILKPTIPDTLEAANLKFQRAILYNTVVSDLSDLENVFYDILVFFSPEGIKSLYKNFPDFKQNDTRIAAFGATTHAAVKERGLRLDIAAPTPEYPSMTKAIEEYIKEVNKGK